MVECDDCPRAPYIPAGRDCIRRELLRWMKAIVMAFKLDDDDDDDDERGCMDSALLDAGFDEESLFLACCNAAIAAETTSLVFF